MRTTRLALVLSLFTIVACSNPEGRGDNDLADDLGALEPAPSEIVTTSIYDEDPGVFQERMTITVHKTPSCGCCGKWTDHLRRNSFDIKLVDHDDLAPIKEQLGVPAHHASCHTAEINGLFVEGHVPAQDIRRMVSAAPDAAADIKGIAVPGMPIGSPGMEMGGRVDPYQVFLIDETGEELVFAEYGG